MSFLLLEAKAVKFAEEHHRPQKYGEENTENEFPYFVHPYQVVSIAKQAGLSEDVILACWLHDVLEDTSVSKNKLVGIFGDRVARIVYTVTDEKGWNRKEKHEKTYPLIAQDNDAIAVKLCDRIANVEFGLATESDKVAMYVKEHEYFKNTLQKESHLISLWERLDEAIEKANRKIRSRNLDNRVRI